MVMVCYLQATGVCVLCAVVRFVFTAEFCRFC